MRSNYLNIAHERNQKQSFAFKKLCRKTPFYIKIETISKLTSILHEMNNCRVIDRNEEEDHLGWRTKIEILKKVEIIKVANRVNKMVPKIEVRLGA